MENGGVGWRNWNLARWNEVLVDRVFTKRSDTSSEIVRLDATPQLLISVVEVAAHDDQTVRDCFLNSFPKTRSAFAELFDFASQTRNWRHKDRGLPFFAQLYLTILVASADEETFTIGNFRDRLQKILGLDLAVGHNLNDLPKFWKAAARWTRETGRENVRRLVLPAPERNEVIIGHSKLLAFPSFSDQRQRSNLLTSCCANSLPRQRAAALACCCQCLEFALKELRERLDLPLAEYAKRFSATPAKFLDRNAPAEYHDGLTVAKTFALAIDEAAKLHPAAEPLIVHAALLT